MEKILVVVACVEVAIAFGTEKIFAVISKSGREGGCSSSSDR